MQYYQYKIIKGKSNQCKLPGMQVYRSYIININDSRKSVDL